MESAKERTRVALLMNRAQDAREAANKAAQRAAEATKLASKAVQLAEKPAWRTSRGHKAGAARAIHDAVRLGTEAREAQERAERAQEAANDALDKLLGWS